MLTSILALWAMPSCPKRWRIARAFLAKGSAAAGSMRFHAAIARFRSSCPPRRPSSVQVFSQISSAFESASSAPAKSPLLICTLPRFCRVEAPWGDSKEPVSLRACTASSYKATAVSRLPVCASQLARFDRRETRSVASTSPPDFLCASMPLRKSRRAPAKSLASILSSPSRFHAAQSSPQPSLRLSAWSSAAPAASPTILLTAPLFDSTTALISSRRLTSGGAVSASSTALSAWAMALCGWPILFRRSATSVQARIAFKRPLLSVGGVRSAASSARSMASLSLTIQSCSCLPTRRLNSSKPGPALTSARMEALSSATLASAVSTSIAATAAHSRFSPRFVPKHWAKSCLSRGGIAIVTCFSSVKAVKSSKSHQTRFRYAGSCHGAIIAMMCPVPSTLSLNACLKASNGITSPAACFSFTLCWLMHTQQIHTYVRATSRERPSQNPASVDAMSSTA
mmetsp:Transcript_71948/g.227395  ORF Transcript_71948/g.227395 Transcript_71948/m.227395 type:complete len:456 (+) Transcript_71948:106-1473(+)